VPLPVALNTPGLVWNTFGNASWHGLTNISHDGVAAGQSGPITNGQSSSLQIVVTGPSTVSFWWKVSSKANSDSLTFSIGGVPAASISGDVDWVQPSVYLPAGNQILQWTYAKGTNGSDGLDAAWVDQFSITDGPTPPFIVTQPVGQSSIGGTPVKFTVTAAGTPQLAYQWRFNGVNIPGATGTSYSIANPRTSNNGAYSVTVSNSFGTTNSIDALLGIVPIYAAGDNSFGQTSVPPTATNAIALAAGAWHSLALRPDGIVLAWGDNGNGQCNVPANLNSVVGIAAGGYHSVALKSDRTVVAWGASDSGQTTVPSGLANVISVAAGSWHTLALRADGTVVAWGDNTYGESTVPPGLQNVVAIAAGGRHSLALLNDGTVVAWGENTDAQGNYTGQSDVPEGLAGVVMISAGDYHSLAVKSDGTVEVWGDDSQTQSDVPAGLPGISVAAGGGSHSLALNVNHSVNAWGNNWNGQCSFPSSISNVVAIAAGGLHTLALIGTSPATPGIVYPARSGNQFSLVVQTVPGKHYSLEYKNSLSSATWTDLPSIYGLGTLQFLVDPTASGPQKVYRVRQF
jgi:hypothetical protein